MSSFFNHIKFEVYYVCIFFPCPIFDFKAIKRSIIVLYNCFSIVFYERELVHQSKNKIKNKKIKYKKNSPTKQLKDGTKK